MSEADRRQYLRVLFESTIEVRTDQWRDPVATGLDISLNGCRFHCEHSMSDGETVTIAFTPDFEMEGKVRWCWPIEWYYQAAVQFIEISEEEQTQLRDYIIEVTGEDYPLEEEEITAPEAAAAKEESLLEEAGDIVLDDDDLGDLSFEEDQLEGFDSTIEEDDLEDFAPLEEDDLLDLEEEPVTVSSASVAASEPASLPEFAEEDLSPRCFEGKQAVIFGGQKEHADLLIQYLTERVGMEIEQVFKKQNLWRLMKIDPLDIVLIEWESGGEADTLEVMEQTRKQFPETQFICLSGPVSLEQRLQVLNAGALDYLTRPIHLSAVAQSVLLQLNRQATAGGAGDVTPLAAGATAISSEDDESELSSLDDELETVDLLDDDLNLSQELDLIDEDF